MPPIALVTTAQARPRDDDLPPLLAALHAIGIAASPCDWDDPAIDWSAYDAAILRCPWDYTQRLPEFLAFIDRVSAQTRLFNPPEVVRANTDKHYLGALAELGLSVVPSLFLEPGDRAETLLAWLPDQGDCVVKPCVGAGSQDALRFGPSARSAAVGHAQRLLSSQRAVLVQPYLDRVDDLGETALIFIDGQFSHAIRKGPLLQRDTVAGPAMFAPERIQARGPGEDELALAHAVLASLPGPPLLYARVDLLRQADGAPCVLELELTEPSLFFAQGPGSVERMAAAIRGRVNAAR